VIVAHDNVRKRMSTEQFITAMNQKIPASPRARCPVVTFAEGVSLHLNGDTLHVIHVADAHTDGDACVHWQKANVLHMGDTFFHKVTFPVRGHQLRRLDRRDDRRGQSRPWLSPTPRLASSPGHGPSHTRGTRRLSGHARRCAHEGRGGIRARRTLAQIKASAPAARYGMPDGFMKPDQFVEAVYNSLTQRASGPIADGAAADHSAACGSAAARRGRRSQAYRASAPPSAPHAVGELRLFAIAGREQEGDAGSMSRSAMGKLV
jgi:hypothetical protein